MQRKCRGRDAAMRSSGVDAGQPREIGRIIFGIDVTTLCHEKPRYRRPPVDPIPETAERRAALGRAITEQTGLDAAVIEDFLRAFYGAARQDPLLGPAFAGVADWEAHIETLTRFWGSVALM